MKRHTTTIVVLSAVVSAALLAFFIYSRAAETNPGEKKTETQAITPAVGDSDAEPSSGNKENPGTAKTAEEESNDRTDAKRLEGKKERVPAFSRPQDRGEDLSDLTSSELVKRLDESDDKIELRKVAKQLGDRSINGTLNLNQKEKQIVDKAVTGYLKQTNANDSNERAEAKQQIERFWHTAVPTLMDNVGNKDLSVAELAIKSLILMRNKDIIKQLIKKGRRTTDDRRRKMIIFTLKKMKEQRRSLIPGRECLDREQSRELYDKLVDPALNKLKSQAPQ